MFYYKINTIFNNDVKFLFKILNKNDELMLVGGCVRNYILNKKINDFDFATKLKPDEVIEILEKNNIKYLTIGIKFGTITAIINNNKYEITSLRNDINTNGRHTDVNFINSYLEDAKRRDFTFNALYIDYNGKIYDYFNGINDLKKGIIRFIGEPEKRIEEDYLRILRFFRFYSDYAYTFDYKSFNACIKYREKIKNLSKERIKYEFLRILEGKYPIKVLKIMDYYGIIEQIFNIKNLYLYNLEIFFSIRNYINYDFNSIFILSLILIKNEINNIKNLLVLTNNEYNFIQKTLEYKNIEINEDNIKVLFFKLKDKELIKQIIIINIINNYNKNSINEINNYINFIDNLDIIKLPITIDDLKNIGINNNNYNKYMKLSKEYFIKNKLKCDKNDIINYITSIYKKSNI